MNGSTHAGCAHLDAMRRFPEPTMFFQGGISMRFQLGFERLCVKWYNRAEEQGESERRWSNEKTQLPQ